MAEMEKQEFKFPDEVEDQGKPLEQVEEEQKLEASGPELEIEVEDDTPEEDKGRRPADPEQVKKLEVEVDDLDKYSKEAKDKLIKMKRVWNDERREKERALREQQAALDAAQRLMDENKRIKEMLSKGEAEYKAAVTTTSEVQYEMAKRAYKEAYDAGDSEKLMEAQAALTKAQIQLESAKNFKLPPLQEEKFDVQSSQQYQPAPQQDRKLMDWQNRNTWFGQDEEMTAAALGLHEKLKRQGVQIGSDDYYAKLDSTMRKRFPENFDEDIEPPEVEVEEAAPKADTPKAKPATVVAPATRSTAPKKIRLKTSQVAIAKKLGLTPEQYVRELMKLEA
jgi:hypothetical protein